MLHFKLSKQDAIFLQSLILSTSMICFVQASAFDTLHKDIRFENNKFITKNPKVNFDNTKFKAQVELEQGGQFKAEWTGEKVGDNIHGRFTETYEVSEQEYILSTKSFDENGYPRSETKCFGSSSNAFCATATERVCERIREAKTKHNQMEQCLSKYNECTESLSYSKKLIDEVMRESSDFYGKRMAVVDQDMKAMKDAAKKRKHRTFFYDLSNITTESGATDIARSKDQKFPGLRAASELMQMCSTAGKFVKANTSAAKPVPAKTGTN